jgi:CheY-like chemotaxis protein
MAGSILVVDDDRMIRALASGILLKAGWSVHLADNGLEALQQLQKSRFDLLATDIDMPEMNGHDLVQHVRVHCPGLPIVVMTGTASPQISEVLGQNRLLHVMDKRSLRTELALTVGKLIGLSRQPVVWQATSDAASAQ